MYTSQSSLQSLHYVGILKIGYSITRIRGYSYHLQDDASAYPALKLDVYLDENMSTFPGVFCYHATASKFKTSSLLVLEAISTLPTPQQQP